MDNKEIVVYKENFITKIKKFFKKIFGRYNRKNNSEFIQEDSKIADTVKLDVKEKFTSELKLNIDTIKFNENNILEELNDNKEKLNMLSINRLKKLEKYYDKVIEENKIQIDELKKSA